MVQSLERPPASAIEKVESISSLIGRIEEKLELVPSVRTVASNEEVGEETGAPEAMTGLCSSPQSRCRQGAVSDSVSSPGGHVPRAPLPDTPRLWPKDLSGSSTVPGVAGPKVSGPLNGLPGPYGRTLVVSPAYEGRPTVQAHLFALGGGREPPNR